jgi:hypothetical protein
MAKPAVVTGTVPGTGSAITLELGFIPKFLEVANVTDGDQIWQWYDGMAAGTCLSIAAAVATQATNGVTRNPGARGSTKAGVTLGTAISEAGKTLYYRAYREG